MEGEMCIECLEHVIQSDFSDKLVFSYPISLSSLPFASKAVVKVPISNTEVSAEVTVAYISHQHDPCLYNYVNEHILDDLECVVNNGTEAQNQSEGVYCKSSDVSSKLVSGGFKSRLYGFHCKNVSCSYSGRSSCLRTITAIAPCAIFGTCSFITLEKVVSSLSFGSLEEDILCSLSAIIEGKPTCCVSQNFLRLIGVPSFDDEQVPGCVRHPNLVPVLGLVKASRFTGVVYPKAPFTLENILYFSPEVLHSQWHTKFLIYQLLSALCYLHGLGLTHGNICPSTVLFANSSWVWLTNLDRPLLQCKAGSEARCSLASPVVGRHCSVNDCTSHNLYANLKMSANLDWPTAFGKWWKGELSNFEYLLVLNRLAGRRWGDHAFHTVMPWVIDFSSKPDENCEVGWRDLCKSKWRLAKGDEQLDFTYSTSEIPHHVSDECLSELAVCSYKARRLPLSVLRSAVRSVYEPNEYPSTMERLYQWTPDECIPEFYCDSRIFSSMHSGMSDLAVPSWAGSPQEFILLHRAALESERVSHEIHEWIDITFGYKVSGAPAVDAKNVMLPASQHTVPRPTGRRQLFCQPHPSRWCSSTRMNGCSDAGQPCINLAEGEISFLLEDSYLSKIEEADSFCRHALHLSPIYSVNIDKGPNSSSCEGMKDQASKSSNNRDCCLPRDVDSQSLLKHFEEIESEDDQELFLWAKQSSCAEELPPNVAQDIFSLGCIIAELYLRKPLFDSLSVAAYMDDGTLPGRMIELPVHVKCLVEACVQKKRRRRPSAKRLLECPYFPASIKSSYTFIAPLQLLGTHRARISYAANIALKGVFKSMGSFAAEMCATHCLPLLENSLSDVEAECAYILLKEFLKSLRPEAAKRLVLPTIQKILQATGNSHLKVSLLQDSFVREVWNHVGKHIYLEKIHPLVISNLLFSPHKSSASAASVLLIGSSEEMGVPIAVQQTVLPLIYSLGKGLSADGVDALVRIGVILGENFVITQIVPLLKYVIQTCIDASYFSKPEPGQSWNSSALVDCLRALAGLFVFLPKEVVVKKFLENQSCLFVTILMRSNLELVLQAAASTLITFCQRIGPDLTALHVLPQLKVLFDDHVFCQDSSGEKASLSVNDKVSESISENRAQADSRMDLVLLLYPSLVSLLGIERLRQYCSTWLLIEKYLLIHHQWKWEFTGSLPRNDSGNTDANQFLNREAAMPKYNPTKILMNGVGWTVPQSQGSKASKDLVLHKRLYEGQQNAYENISETSRVSKCEPWFWFPTVAVGDWPGSLARGGSVKDELPWKIKASVVHSVRAHHGALRSLAVDEDECAVFTAGVGPGFKGMVQRWDLSTVDCVSRYYGHDEVVNDICVLPSRGRVASCDGVIHVWNSHTGKGISVISESETNLVQPSISSTSATTISNDQTSMLNSTPHFSGILTSVDGSVYTCMRALETMEKLVVGTGNGSLRFIDAASGEKLHLWTSESATHGFPSLVSAICSCGSEKKDVNSSHSWIAVGLSSGNCRLLDLRSGSIITSWRAHNGYITKLAAPEDHYLVSSSLDKTLRIWDLRKNLPPQPVVYNGHSDSVMDFSVWGQDVVSISKNKVGLSSLAGTADEYGQHRVVRQALYTADRGTRNMSVLTSIAILPFSRLFLVGTEDGQLKICC